MGRMCSVRTKFNEALNDAVAEIGHNIMNITDCSLPEHFDNKGVITQTGKDMFWHQLDELIEQFDINKIMLLPNGKRRQQNNRENDQAAVGMYNQDNTSNNSHYTLPKI